jgi:hypothetical protein
MEGTTIDMIEGNRIYVPRTLLDVLLSNFEFRCRDAGKFRRNFYVLVSPQSNDWFPYPNEPFVAE